LRPQLLRAFCFDMAVRFHVKPCLQEQHHGRNPLIETAALEAALQRFADERDWQRYHTPRNLMLALTGEVGELAEIFQWLTDEEVAQLADDPARFTHLQEEVADVLLYLVRLASVMKLDINAAVRDKLQKNAVKYPAPAADAPAA
jgi:NTP pyrophosphatase (non-canonical NTP hydrolase)